MFMQAAHREYKVPRHLAADSVKKTLMWTYSKDTRVVRAQLCRWRSLQLSKSQLFLWGFV